METIDLRRYILQWVVRDSANYGIKRGIDTQVIVPESNLAGCEGQMEHLIAVCE